MEGNPINFADPTGLFPRDLIFKNIDYNEFEHLNYPAWLNHGAKRMRYGFLALLLEADNFDVIGVGYLQLQKPQPTVAYNLGLIYTDCETIFVDGQPLKYFYETKVKNQNEPWIWWRDTSASYYQLNLKTTYVDGDYSTDLPLFHSIDIGALFANGDLLVDLDGNFYLSISAGHGESGGFSYTESYLCLNENCHFNPYENDFSNLIEGACINSGGQVLVGYQISICGNPLNNPTAVHTFSSGFQAGFSLPAGSYTWSLASILPQNREFGWRAAIDARRNGTHRSDLQLYP